MRSWLVVLLLAVVGCSDRDVGSGDTLDGLDVGAELDASLGAEIDASLVDQDVPCPPGFAFCGGSCVNRLESPTYCGADPSCERFTSCRGNEVCVEGVCALECEPGLTNCDGFCVDPRSEARHCGASHLDCSGGVSCAPDEVCGFGRCEAACPPGSYECFGRCVDPLSDREFCGVGPDCMGGDGACSAGRPCSLGECVDSCRDGLLACGDRCVDPSSDATYCGAADDCTGGTVCTGREVCVEGRCVAACPAPLLACGGRCVDPSSDDGFCGAGPDCTGGEICARDSECRAGSCILTCPLGRVVCDGTCVDPRTDEDHCGASATCSGGVACDPREECMAGACGCLAPERDCGGVCVDVRFDAANCGACGRTCAATERCVASACVASTGLTGGFGDAWTSSSFDETHCIQEFVPRGETDLYAGREGRFFVWETGAMRSRAATAPPYTIQPGCSFASYGGGIFQVTSTDLTFYQPLSSDWRTAPLGMDLGPIGMTITDLRSLWSASARFLYEGAPATSTLATIPLPTTLRSPRLTWEALSDRVFFAGQGERALRSYDPTSRSFRVESLAPGPIGPAFCGDRAGHVYVGSEADPRRIWQYTPASDAWIELPLLPASVTGTTNCGVAETGALYVASAPGAELHRLDLERR
jgi:hypothetical protein